MFLGFDWIFNSPGFFDLNITKSVNLKELLKPFLFVDYSYGIQRTLLEGQDVIKAHLTGAGLGFKVSQGKSFSGNLLVAFPLGENFDPAPLTPPEVKDRRVVFDFQYSF